MIAGPPGAGPDSGAGPQFASRCTGHARPAGDPAPPGTPAPPGSPVATLVGAGDIAQCGSGGPSVSKAEASADILDGIPRNPLTAVFTAGDNAYDVGSAARVQVLLRPDLGSPQGPDAAGAR